MLNTKTISPRTNSINKADKPSSDVFAEKTSKVQKDNNSDDYLAASGTEFNELKKDIQSLKVLANQINDKIVRTRMNLSNSFSSEEDVINAVKSITESYQNINFYIMEDNISKQKIPEFDELSSHIMNLQDQVYKTISEPLSNKSENLNKYSKSKGGNPDLNECHFSEANPVILANNYPNNQEISIGNIVMGEGFNEHYTALNEIDINHNDELLAPLIDKEDYADNRTISNHITSPYYQNSSSNLEIKFSNQSSGKVIKIGLSVMFAVMIMIFILYFIS